MGTNRQPQNTKELFDTFRQKDSENARRIADLASIVDDLKQRIETLEKNK